MRDVTVTLPEEEYKYLLKCRRIIELETDKEFSIEFLHELRKSEEDIETGKGIHLKSKKEVKKFLNEL